MFFLFDLLHNVEKLLRHCYGRLNAYCLIFIISSCLRDVLGATMVMSMAISFVGDQDCRIAWFICNWNMMGESGLYLGGASRPGSCLQPWQVRIPFYPVTPLSPL